MGAVLTERLVAVALAARVAGQGGKGAVYEAACRELGMSRATLARKIREVAVMAPRKRRADAGQSALTPDEARLISAALMETTRKNDKRLYSIKDAVTMLRANRAIRAEFLDMETGELRALSESTIHRALRMYGLHPDQLLAPAPVTEMASRHPNHVWQIDASLCTLYYLSNGLKGLDGQVYYKNKPGNLERVSANRVWRYVVTDHASGWLYVEYVLGAESGENLCSVFIHAIQERGGADMMHGCPMMIVTDPGAAMTGALFRNLCRALGVDLVINAVGNARAKGQVENANNLVETKFEPGLALRPVSSLEELNALAKAWRENFNATEVHRRHGRPRSLVWMAIRADQLIKAPSIDVCRELAVATPESRKVTPKLRVSFQGREYDVSTAPGVMVGEKVMLTRNPWRDDAAQVVLVGEDGRDVFHVVHQVFKDELGFSVKAAVFGESYKRHADTPAQTALKDIGKLVTGTDSQTDAKAARKTKSVPFGGRLDPYKHIDDATLPVFLPRRGTVHGLVAPTVELPPLSHVDAARQIKPRVESAGGQWSAEHFRWLQQRYPAGVHQDQFDTIVAELCGPRAGLQRPLQVLRAVAGGG
ncbi:transposase [Verminephrobacter aporrectodeae subsp. tuberculatae]|uniref:DDE-type integrase/transposase/recombinase n=1 Tax=Verminephrobacter aporrectodeae TaxID=1110389 RepID=UPI0022381716|nr:DDE-type integrase/transposase/recombinase [Verminephrobacter aporrectodeae]MCW5223499.1 transposase [Verminephrobacter aporrectodeae subsp. tuberculatae]MCW5288963.1 transposase [Verminephrobacter aporrectodeae subsp. tuberculatae]